MKQLHPLSLAAIKDQMTCTVLVVNLPNDHSVENLYRVFGKAGEVKFITISDPNDAYDQRKLSIAEKLVSGRLHALVEYDSVDAAKKAVATLNNEHDWRFGLRVILLKKDNKQEQRKKTWRDFEEEKTGKVQTSNQPATKKNQGSTKEENSIPLPKKKT